MTGVARPGCFRPVALLIAATLAMPANAVTFADGLVHVIDAGNTYAFESVEVQDNVQGQATSIELVTGGEIGTRVGGLLGLNGSSRAVVSGGRVPYVAVRDDSTLEVTSSDDLISSVQAVGTASVLTSGGQLGDVRTFYFSEILVLGGSLQLLVVTGESSGQVLGGIARGISVGEGATLVVGGGSVSENLIAGGASNLSMNGGAVQGKLQSWDSSVVFVSGGALSGGIEAHLQSTVELSGGRIAGELVALGSAAIEVIGRDFNYPLGDLPPTTGTLSGVLLDGSEINIAFGRASTARITLVPEPTAGVLLAFATALLGTLRWLRNAGGERTLKS